MASSCYHPDHCRCCECQVVDAVECEHETKYHILESAVDVLRCNITVMSLTLAQCIGNKEWVDDVELAIDESWENCEHDLPGDEYGTASERMSGTVKYAMDTLKTSLKKLRRQRLEVNRLRKQVQKLEEKNRRLKAVSKGVLAAGKMIARRERAARFATIRA